MTPNAIQERFRERLWRIRRAQIEAAGQRSMRHRVLWESYLEALRIRRKAAEQDSCPGCDMSLRLHECRCKRPATPRELTRMIRRLAGISTARGHGKGSRQWSDWNGGKPGSHACGPSLWDDVVKAAEDGCQTEVE